MEVLLFGCVGKDIQPSDNQMIKRSLGCIRTWCNMDPSDSRLKVLGSRKQHEHSYSKRMCCTLWTEIPVPVNGRLTLQLEDFEQMSSVSGRANLYIHFMHRECSYYSQIITHNVLHFYNGSLTKVRQTYILSVPCCSVMKQLFHVNGVSNTQNAHMWALNNAQNT